VAKLKKKFIESGAVGSNEILLENASYLKGRNQADSVDIDMIRVNASDALELASKLNDPDSTAPSADTELANKKYVDDQLATITIPSVFELQGNWDGSTNTPTLANTDTGVADYLYYVNAAGSVDFGAGSKTFAVGDWVYNVNGAWEKADNNDDVLSVNGQAGTVVLNTEDIAESGDDLYYTAARSGLNVKLAGSTMDSAANLTLAGGGEVLGLPASPSATGAASKEYVDTQVGGANADAENETITLDGTDISNGYVDLGFEGMDGSFDVTPVGGLLQEEDTDYTVLLTGGVGSVTRITFAGDLAAELVDTDKLMIKYLRA